MEQHVSEFYKVPSAQTLTNLMATLVHIRELGTRYVKSQQQYDVIYHITVNERLAELFGEIDQPVPDIKEEFDGGRQYTRSEEHTSEPSHW